MFATKIVLFENSCQIILFTTCPISYPKLGPKVTQGQIGQ